VLTQTPRSQPSAAAAARWSIAISCFAPAIAFLYAGYECRWAGDDGFINTRVVKQLMDGNGFVFNAGERVEAVTSAGWVLLLWFLGELGFDIDSAGWLASLALSFIGLSMMALASTVLTRPDEPQVAQSFVLPFGVLAYAAIPVAWDYETSLLENGLGLAFLGIAYWLVAREVVLARFWPVALTAAFVGLAPLVRPDFAIYGGPLTLILLLQQTRWKARAKLALCAALPGGSFQIFRMGYFASLVPNTAIAKEAFDARWEQGLHYLDNTVGSYQLLVPLALTLIAALAVIIGLARAGLWLRALLPASLVFCGALHVLYVVRVGGDFMHGRMLLPGLFAGFGAIGTVRVSWPSRTQRVMTITGFAVMAVWAIACARSLRPVMFVNDILDERRWWSETAGVPHPIHLEDYKAHTFYGGPSWVKAKIAEGCPAGLASLGDDMGDYCKRVAWPDLLDGKLSDYVEGTQLPLNGLAVASQVVAVYAFRPLGISGRVMGLRINLTDSFGLADPLASRMELLQRGRPGHEKVYDPVWWAAKYTAPGATQDPRVAVAKRALGCGLLHDLQLATHEPMTMTRFFKNVRLAFVLHRVRVPADPQVAVERFCTS
jgi:arabinofuranosyltransferase